MQSYNKKALKWLAVLAIAPVVAIASSGNLAIAQNSSLDSTTATPPAVTKVLPADAAGAILINTTEKNWETLNRFNPFPFALTGPGMLPFLPPGIDFSTDVQPWIGEWAAIALLPVQSAPQSAADAPSSLGVNLLMLAPAKDSDRLNAFVAKFKENSPEAAIERQYQGITILEWPAKEPPPIDDVPEENLPPNESPDSPPLPQSHSLFPTANLSPLTLNLLPAALVATKNASPPMLEPSEEETLPSEPTAPMMSKPGLAIAVLPGYLVASTNSVAIEQFINTQPGIKPLADTPKFQRTFKHPEFGRSLFVGYGNLATITQLNLSENLPEIPGGLPIPLPPLSILSAFLQPLAETYDTTEMFAWVQAEGIRSQASAYYKTPQPDRATQPTPDADNILTKLPPATYLSVNSRNFKQQWQKILDTSPEGTSTLFDLLRQFVQKNIGLNLDSDIISWMDGEYGLFFFPATDGFFPYLFPQLKLGMGMMVKTSDRPAAEQTLNKLNEFVSTSAPGIVTINRSLDNAEITSWEIEETGRNAPQSLFAHRWIDNNTLILTTGTGPLSALDPQRDRSLASSYIFKTATATLPQPNEGYFYLNWGATLSFIYTFLPTDNNSEFVRLAKQVAGTLRSFSLTYSSTPEKQQTDALLVLAPANK